jgi:hypothetical protein
MNTVHLNIYLNFFYYYVFKIFFIKLDRSILLYMLDFFVPKFLVPNGKVATMVHFIYSMSD